MRAPDRPQGLQSPGWQRSGQRWPQGSRRPHRRPHDQGAEPQRRLALSLPQWHASVTCIASAQAPNHVFMLGVLVSGAWC